MVGLEEADRKTEAALEKRKASKTKQKNSHYREDNSVDTIKIVTRTKKMFSITAKRKKKVDDSNPTPPESTNFYFFCAITNKKNNPVLKTMIYFLELKPSKKLADGKLALLGTVNPRYRKYQLHSKHCAHFVSFFLGSMFICESEYSLLLMTALIDDKGPWLHREDKKETMSHFISFHLCYLTSSLSPPVFQ